MPIYSMKEILKDAEVNKYGVGFFNAVNMEMTRACIRAAEDLKSPIIIGTAESLLKYGDFDWLLPMMIDAGRRATVPVAIHLDHAYQMDTIMKALRHGFGSVMFDGSLLPVEENIRISKEIIKVAHAMDAGVECELGKVGGLEEGEGVIGENQYTNVSDVVDFVDKTEVDFLAISIGTTHGNYKEAPKLDLVRLAEIREITDVALVLHGGSGLSEQDFRNCIAGGIQKINIYTDVVTAASNAACREDENPIGYMELLKNTEDAMYDVVANSLKVFGSDNRA